MTDQSDLDPVSLDEAASALRSEWAYQPGAILTPWDDIGRYAQEQWRRAARAAITTYVRETAR